jgi:hypothetical protein
MSNRFYPFTEHEKNMKQYFPELPTRFPPYYLCNFQQQNTENNTIDQRREAFVRNGNRVTRGENLGYQITPTNTWNYQQAPKEARNEFSYQEVLENDFVNLGGRGDLFYGYARSVDVESELKGINFINDKCFDAENKINPNYPNTSLYLYKDVLNKKEISNYMVEKPIDINQMEIDKTRDKNYKKNSSEIYLKVQENTYRYQNNQPYKCLDTNQPPPKSIVKPYEETKMYYETEPAFPFKNINDCFPTTTQQPWNNITKRKMIYTRQKF